MRVRRADRGGNSMSIKYPRIRQRGSSAGVFFLALTGCSGGEHGMSTNSMANPPMTMLTADFDSIQANIFTPICSGCHSGANPAANLSLDAAHSYNDLVNVPSTEEPALDRVKPGDPTDSYLVIHLQKDGDGASPSDIQFVVQWVQDGALPGSSPMTVHREFKVAAVQPDPGDRLNAPPPRVVIGFTQELDPGSLNPAAVRLERINEASNEENEVILMTPSIPTGNARALLLTPANPLSPGRYQVVLNLDAGAAVRAQSGAPLYARTADLAGQIVTHFSVAPH